MASPLHICIFFLALSFFVFFNLSSYAAETNQSLIFPIRKDDATNQYYTEMDMGSNLDITYVVIDLGGQFLWFDCEAGYNSSSYRAIDCESNECEQAKGSGCVSCNLTPRPGCTNNTCGIFPYNPISNLLAAEGLGEDVTRVYQTDGRFYLLSTDVPHFPFSCSHSFQLEGLANGTKGMLGLARTKTALPTQLGLAFNLPRKFALCIPSSIVNGFGDLFVGGGPYYTPPYAADLSKELITTPLVINPVSTAAIYSEGDPSDEYFIQVTSIKVNEKLVKFNTSLLSIDEKGVGGTKISTTTPYTVLHATIYKRLLKEFLKKTKTKKITRVASVAPFGACFSSKTIGSTTTGPDVPNINLVLQSESVYWRIYGANSMVKVTNGVMCLGFIDGGVEPRTSIVIGGHQLEDNLIEFDLDSSKFGFTSSLLLKNSSCSQYRLF